ncbi:MAG: hypothetical protein H8E55_10860 [Pelagibacterales bacterium]|nr:hypothetical protein [Pelagibacterales bacterium]
MTTESMSILAIFIAISSIIINYYFYLKNRYVSKISKNQDVLTQTQIMMLNNPEFLELHNVTSNELKSCGVNEKEFIYILLTFYAGQTYYYLDGKRRNIQQTPYRRNLFSNPKVKNCWQKIIRDKMISSTKWSESIDDFYENN